MQAFSKAYSYNHINCLLTWIHSIKILANLKRPRNVILFVGDGMSLTTVTAARIYRGQQTLNRSGEELLLSWEEFPETALLKVWL